MSQSLNRSMKIFSRYRCAGMYQLHNYLSTNFQRSKVPSHVLNIVSLSSRFLSTSSEETALIADPVMHIGGDFGELVTESSIFIDRSLFIEEIIKDRSKVILITMPRRWGKSLNLDMLRRFLSIEEENEEEKLFNRKIFKEGTTCLNAIAAVQLNITKSKTLIRESRNLKETGILTLQGQYPVIFIDFKDCIGRSVEEVQIKFKKKMLQTIRNFSYLNKSKKAYKDTTFGREYKALLNEVKNNDFSDAIKELTELLRVYHGKKVWLLIDEYDAALNQAYLKFNVEDVDKVSMLYRIMYQSALKGNSLNLEKGVLTGVQYVVKSGMLSGLNNASKYNVTSPRYSKYYGLSTAEMGVLLEHFNLKEKEKKIKDWYNGYKSNIGTDEEPVFIDKYNIWSVVNYLKHQAVGFKSYWENNSLGELINAKILKNSAIKDSVEGLINNRNLLLRNFTSEFSVTDFQTLKSIVQDHDQIEITSDGIDLVFSYLFITGYLTITSGTYEYCIPNKEIRIEFEKKISEYYKQIFNLPPSEFNELTMNIGSGISEEDVKNISSIFTKKFAPNLSKLISKLKLFKGNNEIRGLFANEDLMHSLLNYIAIQIVNAKFASERHTTKTNGRKGRADIVIEKNNKGILIEMKSSKEHVNKALEQAKDYGKLIKDAQTKIFIGCNITDQGKVFISGEIVSGKTSIRFQYP